ncbi:MAG: hypothetical protein LBJ77_02675 [Holosporales bacterium]|jgi:hypothetical protein|nr:hypothetical protein [Holosporales bacterium]
MNGRNPLYLIVCLAIIGSAGVRAAKKRYNILHQVKEYHLSVIGQLESFRATEKEIQYFCEKKYRIHYSLIAIRDARQRNQALLLMAQQQAAAPAQTHHPAEPLARLAVEVGEQPADNSEYHILDFNDFEQEPWPACFDFPDS